MIDRFSVSTDIENVPKGSGDSRMTERSLSEVLNVPTGNAAAKLRSPYEGLPSAPESIRPVTIKDISFL